MYMWEKFVKKVVKLFKKEFIMRRTWPYKEIVQMNKIAKKLSDREWNSQW